MRKRKVLAMVAGLVLSMSVAVPGTLAVEADSAGTESSSISVTSEDGTGAGAETGEGASTAAVTDFAAAAVAAVQTTASGSPESTSSEDGSGESTASDANEKTGTDAAEKTGTEASSEASEETETDATDKTAASAGTETGAGTGAGTGTETGAGTATGTETGTADGASKAAANASGASKDQNAANASETFTHKDGCGDDCKDESCTCGCHLYRQIMACGTIDEIWEILDNADEASFSLLSEEQNAKIDARIEELEPEPAPAIVIEEATETVPSIIEYGLVSFTDVAPLGEPVTGGAD